MDLLPADAQGEYFVSLQCKIFFCIINCCLPIEVVNTLPERQGADCADFAPVESRGPFPHWNWHSLYAGLCERWDTAHQLTDCVLSLEESISTLCLFKLVKMKAKKVMRMCQWSWQAFKQHIWTELQDQGSKSFDFLPVSV